MIGQSPPHTPPAKPKHREVVATSIGRKVLTVQSKLYDTRMSHFSDPEAIDSDYTAFYHDLITQSDSTRKGGSGNSNRHPALKQRDILRRNLGVREELKQINENARKGDSGEKMRKPAIPSKKAKDSHGSAASRHQDGTRQRLYIRLEDFKASCGEANGVSGKNAPVVVQSTQLEFTKEARLFIEAQKRKGKAFDTIIESAANFRGSAALRHPDRAGSRKSPTFDKVSLLPSNAFMLVVSFLTDQFRVHLCVNPSWYSATVDAFDEAWNGAENRFIQAYGKFLLFKDSYTSSSRICCADAEGVRVDRVIRCENLAGTVGRTFVIGYTYRYSGEPGNVYRAVYKFDSVKRGDKLVWIYRNQCFVPAAALSS